MIIIPKKECLKTKRDDMLSHQIMQQDHPLTSNLIYNYAAYPVKFSLSIIASIGFSDFPHPRWNFQLNLYFQRLIIVVD